MSHLIEVVPIPLARRFIIALISLAACAMLFRGQVAIALVTRGDGFLQQGELARARVYYRRALAFEPGSSLAADRFAFAGYQLRTPEALRDSIDVSSRALLDHPDDGRLLYDRAMCYRILHRDHEALRDFARVAARTGDPRMYHFAAWAAYRTRNIRAARSYWRLALSRDPHFLMARFALHKLRLAR